MKDKNKQLLIIDGNAVIHRSFHALPPTLKTKDGIMVNAVYGFTSFLMKAISQFQPEFVILTLDKAGPTFRHESYADYKATRVKAADELYEQIPLIKEMANAFGIPIFEKSGFEADDLIGSLAKQAEKEKNIETIIVTGDLDTLQLITQKTKVYTMSRGLSDSILYDEYKVKERYNLSPIQIIDYKALAGDASDNIPGAKGIGEKTAIELLTKFHTIEKLYKAVKTKDESIKERHLKLLIESEENVFLSKKLATIDCQADIKLSLNKAKFLIDDIEKITSLFARFEFKSLIPKLTLLNSGGKNLQDDKANEKNINIKAVILKDEKSITNFLQQALKQETISIFLDENENTEKIRGMAFSFKDDYHYFLPFNKDSIIKLKPIWENENIKKIGHNLKPVWKILKNNNLLINGLHFDTLIASYLLNPGERKYQLENVLFSELGIDLFSNKKETDNIQSTQMSLELTTDWQEIGNLACFKSHLIFNLYEKLQKRLKKEELLGVFTDLEMPLISVLAKMEQSGIKVNTKILNDLDKIVLKKIKDLEEKIYQFSHKKFNINSTKQLKEILFSDLEIPTTGLKKTKTGYSTAEEELNKIKDFHPIIPLIQEYRELTKLETTYLNALPKMVHDDDKRIHTTFSQVIAATGRLSSYDPNLQNIPTKTEEGRLIRSAFIAEKDYLLVGFDYSQIELRVAAHFSKDEAMTSAFKKKVDIHTETAAKINEVDLEDVTPKMRREAKAINFGILYGQGPHGLSQSAHISYSQAKDFIDKYFQTYPNIKKMVDSFIKEAKEKGYVSTLFNRKRYLPDINSSMPFIKKAAERMAINTPIQGTAADIIKRAMIKIDEKIKKSESDIKLLLQVHDELIFEIKKDKVEEFKEAITKIMQSNSNLEVPMVVKTSQGSSWKDLK